MVPTIGLRMKFKESNKVVTYSCDTEPCQEVLRLARGADILFHEASGDVIGHSSSGQAGKIASEAGVGQLYLIHYPTGDFWQDNLLEDARNHFDGKVTLAEDLMVLEL